MEEWLEKCLSCKHSYHRNDDADTIYCRCRNGKYNYESDSKTVNDKSAKESDNNDSN